MSGRAAFGSRTLGIPGRHADDVCMYDDGCLAEPSDVFPGLTVCTSHALKIHDVVEAMLALEQVGDAVAEKRRLVQACGQNYGATVAEYADHRLSTDPGFVYFVRFDNMVKIGFSKNPTQRLRETSRTRKSSASCPAPAETSARSTGTAPSGVSSVSGSATGRTSRQPLASTRR